MKSDSGNLSRLTNAIRSILVMVVFLFGCSANVQVGTKQGSSEAIVWNEGAPPVEVSDISSPVVINVAVTASEEMIMTFLPGTFSKPLRLTVTKKNTTDGISFGAYSDDSTVELLKKFHVSVPDYSSGQPALLGTESSQVRTLHFYGPDGQISSTSEKTESGRFEVDLEHFFVHTFFESPHAPDAALWLENGSQLTAPDITIRSGNDFQPVSLRIYSDALCQAFLGDAKFDKSATFTPAEIRREFSFSANAVNAAGTESRCQSFTVIFAIQTVISDAVYQLNRENVPYKFNPLMQLSNIQTDITYQIIGSGPYKTVKGGTIEKTADGSLSYTPASKFFGTDTWRFPATDNLGRSVEVPVTFEVKNAPLRFDLKLQPTGQVRADGELTVHWSATDVDDMRRVGLSVTGSADTDCSTGTLLTDILAGGSPQITKINMTPYANSGIHVCIFDLKAPSVRSVSSEILVYSTPHVSFPGFTETKLIDTDLSALTMSLSLASIQQWQTISAWSASSDADPETCVQKRNAAPIPVEATQVLANVALGSSERNRICVQVLDQGFPPLLFVTPEIVKTARPVFNWIFPSQNNPESPKSGLSLLWNYVSETAETDQLDFFADTSKQTECAGTATGSVTGGHSGPFIADTSGLSDGLQYYFCAKSTDSAGRITHVWTDNSVRLSDTQFFLRQLTPQQTFYGLDKLTVGSNTYFRSIIYDSVAMNFTVKIIKYTAGVGNDYFSRTFSEYIQPLPMSHDGDELAVPYCLDDSSVELSIIKPDGTATDYTLTSDTDLYDGDCPAGSLAPTKKSDKWYLAVGLNTGGGTPYQIRFISIDATGSLAVENQTTATASWTTIGTSALSTDDSYFIFYSETPNILKFARFGFDGSKAEGIIAASHAEGRYFYGEPVHAGDKVHIAVRGYVAPVYSAILKTVNPDDTVTSTLISDPAATASSFGDVLKSQSGIIIRGAHTIAGRVTHFVHAADSTGATTFNIPFDSASSTIGAISKTEALAATAHIAYAENAADGISLKYLTINLADRSHSIQTLGNTLPGMTVGSISSLRAGNAFSVVYAGSLLGKYVLRAVTKVGESHIHSTITQNSKTNISLSDRTYGRIFFLEGTGATPMAAIPLAGSPPVTNTIGEIPPGVMSSVSSSLLSFFADSVSKQYFLYAR